MARRIRNAWQLRAVCGQQGMPKTTEPCQACPVKFDCLEHALESPWMPHGIWGGLKAKDLRELWKELHPHNRAEIQRAIAIDYAQGGAP